MKNGHYYLNFIPKEALEEFKQLSSQHWNSDGGLKHFLNQSFVNFNDFIGSSFPWHKSKLGTNYWLFLKPIEIPVIPEQRIDIPLPCGVSC